MENYNLSPQGDGNKHNRILPFKKKPLQLIPVRGRKKPLELIHGHLNYNLSPRGDGNPIFLSAIVIYIPITTYPRKGTETSLPLCLC